MFQLLLQQMNTNTKKIYSKPEVSVHNIDNEISLVMMTWIDDTPPPPPAIGGAPAAKERPTQRSNFKDNPFGE